MSRGGCSWCRNFIRGISRGIPPSWIEGLAPLNHKLKMYSPPCILPPFSVVPSSFATKQLITRWNMERYFYKIYKKKIGSTNPRAQQQNGCVITGNPGRHPCAARYGDRRPGRGDVPQFLSWLISIVCCTLPWFDPASPDSPAVALGIIILRAFVYYSHACVSLHQPQLIHTSWVSESKLCWKYKWCCSYQWGKGHGPWPGCPPICRPPKLLASSVAPTSPYICETQQRRSLFFALSF